MKVLASVAAVSGVAMLAAMFVTGKARRNDKIRRWREPIDALQNGETADRLFASRTFRDAGDFNPFARYVAGEGRVPRDGEKAFVSMCADRIAFVYTDVSNRVTFKFVCDQ